MASSRVEVEDEASSVADHEVNQVLSRLTPLCLAAALTLILAGSLAGNSGIAHNGIIALIAAPILTMVASTWVFARQHDSRFVMVSTFVLVVIVLGAVSGIR